MTIKKGDILELKIEKLVFGGSGIGRVEGQVVFVDFSAPGDYLKVEIFECKKKYSRGRILEILQPSKSRVNPVCKVFGQCGGCQWQHINYEEQIQTKKTILEEIVNRLPFNEKAELNQFQPSSNTYEYRNRILFHVDEFGTLGFYEKGSHRLVEIDRCEIAEKSLNIELKNIKKKKLNKGKYRLQIGLNNSVTMASIELQEEPLGFAQVNTSQNRYLQSLVLKTYEKYKGSSIYDIYGGYGNFSFPLAKEHPNIKIECVEWSYKSIQKGIQLSKQQKIKNIHFINSDVKIYFERVRIDQDSFVVIDPPREGCDSLVINELIKNHPKCIVYISCDPMTWGRDAQQIFDAATQNGVKYRVATIHGLDMFPQTDHIEVFSVFEKVDE